MAEQILQIESVDPKELHGPNDKHLDLVKSMFPKLKIIARGDFVKVIGDEDEIDYFISRYETLMMQLERFGKLTAQNIEDVMMSSTDTELQQKMSESDVLVFGRSGVPVKAITTNQKRMVTASEQKDLVFAIGPAGTGKDRAPRGVSPLLPGGALRRTLGGSGENGEKAPRSPGCPLAHAGGCADARRTLARGGCGNKAIPLPGAGEAAPYQSHASQGLQKGARIPATGGGEGAG